MGVIRIEKTKNTPCVYIDKTNNICKIEGSSFPEDAYDVYQPVIEWLETMEGDFSSELKVEFDFDFLNSISHKKVWQILNELQKFHKYGKKVKVMWYYDEDDEEIMESGEDLAELINVPFELCAK